MNKKNRIILIAAMIVAAVSQTFAQGNGLAGINEATSMVTSQGRRITFLYDNQRYFLEKYYLYSQKKHEYLDYIEQYPRSAS